MHNTEAIISKKIHDILCEATSKNPYYSLLQNPIVHTQLAGRFDGDFIIYEGNRTHVLVEIKLSLDKINNLIKEKIANVTFYANIPFVIITDGEKCLLFDSTHKERGWENFLLVDAVNNKLITKKINAKDSLTDDNIKEFILSIKGCYKCLENKADVAAFFNKLSISDFEATHNGINFTEEKEEEFFQKLLGKVKDKICRYLSLTSLFRILKGEEFGMCGLVCMNDKSECFYADDFIGDHVVKDFSKADILELLQLNEIFIMSFVDADKNDDLTMWRLYGDNGKGVSMTFQKYAETDSNFFFSKISYGTSEEEHPELELIKIMRENKIGDSNFDFAKWNVWKHFFKPHHFAVEKESRLIYQRSNSSNSSKHDKEWILTEKGIISPLIKIAAQNFPFKLEKITLGPVASEQQTLVAELRALAYEKKFSKLKIKWENNINTSKINIYR